MSRRLHYARIISFLSALAATGVILLLATMPTSDVRDLHLLPRPVATYLDTNDPVRNFLGGLMLQLFMMIPLLFWAPARTKKRAIVLSFLLSAGIFAAAEMIQLKLPARTFDLRDIILGTLGAAIAAGLGILLVALLGVLSRKRPWRAERRSASAVASKNP
jgi:VanZ family protein